MSAQPAISITHLIGAGCLFIAVVPVRAQNSELLTRYSIESSLPAADPRLYKENVQNDLTAAQYAIHSVDSVAHSAAAARHFAWIYTRVMRNVELQIRGADSAAAAFIRKFEIAFAGYFLRACREHQDQVLQPGSEWYNLFSNPGAHSLSLTVMGISAHTNGDMWQTLVSNFSGKEIQQHKKVFLACQASIVKVYNPFFDSIAAQSWYLKLMKKLSLGLVRNLGERIIYKWRLRQVNLALLYFHNHERFLKRLKTVQQKKQQIDKLLLNRVAILLPKEKKKVAPRTEKTGF